MKKVKVAINGFGRIGRTFLRVALLRNDIEVVAIHDLADIHTMAHLFKYDSVHGKWKENVSVEGNSIRIGENSIPFFQNIKDAFPWGELGVEVLVESTGTCKNYNQCKKHLESGAKRVILSAPPEDDSIKTIVLGINEQLIEKSDLVLSNASCTTNSAAHMIQLVDELCEIESCYITTVHSYTGDQRLQDAPHKDLRRGRAAVESIVPTTTGAAKALTRIFPHLNDKMGGCGIRVPVPDGSLTDITCNVKRPLAIEEVNEAFRKAASSRWQNLVEYTEDPIVSKDVIQNPHSCLFDSKLTSVIGDMVKVVGWYDNEFGYSNRLADLVKYCGEL
ncbi:MAG: type I glyceraldehyde-3-phosphate dehydrogenase [Flavobacteriales bacterium]